MKITAIYPGTFDPVTLGHSDLVCRASRLFDRVIVGVAASYHKTTLFNRDERIELVHEVFREQNKVDVIPFEGLLIDFARQQKARALLRGMRAVSDFEFEFQLASMNRALAPEIESVFLTPNEKYAFLSSTLVREVSQLGGDVSRFVHPLVEQALKQKYRHKLDKR